MWQRFLFSSLFAGLTLYLGYGVQRGQFGPFIGAYGLFFGLYALLVFSKKLSAADLRWYTLLGIGLRVVLLFNVPNLSDDFYRFLWDGRLLAQGIHPFTHPPAYFIEHQIRVPGLTPELFARLNSPQYYTVYPPVCQAVFGLAAWLFRSSDWAAVVAMKLFLLGCEVGTLRLLRVDPGPGPSPGGEGGMPSDKQTPLPPWGGAGGGVGAALLYALNPLILLEIVGNCHFEGAMIFFLLAGVAAMGKGRWAAAAVWWALATASKLLPLLFLPLVWRWLGWRRGIYFMLVFSALTAVLFAPLLHPEVLANIGSSLRLYFRQFEFNASVYYLLKNAGFEWTHKNVGRTVGPLLGCLTAAMVLGLAWCRLRRGARMDQLRAALCLAASIYLFQATTVHPWYVTVPLALSLGTPWRFPLLWSGLAALSYSHYANGGFQENYALIAVEYGLVWGWLGWEILCGRRVAHL